ncbi:hypothetical protein NQZ68_017494 [Dissostichus eleginoides]|nr:hypothetical protein NQZ68_017494 [Dissostichus eleginoides]
MQISTSDELLLEKVNIAYTNEKERQDKKKLAAPSRVTNVNTVKSTEVPVEMKSTSQQNKLRSPKSEKRSKRPHLHPHSIPHQAENQLICPPLILCFHPNNPLPIGLNSMPTACTTSSHQQQCRSTDRHSTLHE